jgi:hypothetical protein
MTVLQMPMRGVCDFCGGPKPVRIIRASDVILNEHPAAFRSRNGWAACTQCGALIDADDWGALQSRVVDERMKQPKNTEVNGWSISRDLIEKDVAGNLALMRKHMRLDK